MKKTEKKKILKELSKAESLMINAELRVSALANHIQPLFDEEIYVCWSTDGALVSNDDGELGFFADFLNEL